MSSNYRTIEVEVGHLHAASRAGGGRLNDGFLAGITAGLQKYHQFHGTEVHELRVAMPISQRTAGDEAQWSLQNRVTASTPPALLLAADDDRSVPPVNSVLFYAALKRHGIPASLRIYPSGGHGGALDPAHIYRAQWRADILDWLAMLAHENQKPTSKPR